MAVHDKAEPRPVDVTAGNLVIRLAESEDEVRAAQALRYKIFYKEMDAKPTPALRRVERDFDHFDAYCDHLLVIDAGAEGAQADVVGTYRVMRRTAATACGRFYSSNEYDIAPLLAYSGEILELGRSCVAANYRNGATMTLLWRGIAEYVWHYKIEIMFGCASLPGTDPDSVGRQLAYLHRNHLAPAALRPRALPERYVEMKGSFDAKDLRRGLLMLPPLIKGYLRLGGVVGDGAVVDEDFGTTDICMVVRTESVTGRYLKHYSRDDPSSEGRNDGARQLN